MNLRFLVPAIFLAAIAMAPAKTYPVERPARKSAPATSGEYRILLDQPQQLIEGLGFEIQCDSIGSANQGHPEHNRSVPHDLVATERERLYRDMLAGFRYCRIAGGLYLRGTDEEKKQLEERWPTQMEELKELVDASGVEGISFEYWSPAPFWKSNGRFSGKDGSLNTLRCFGENFDEDPIYGGNRKLFLEDFGEAVVNDIRSLEQAGLPILMFGLQNEPQYDTPYGSCHYHKKSHYAEAFVPVARAVRKHDPTIRIIADTEHGNYIRPVVAKPATRDLVDAIVVHRIGYDSKSVVPLSDKFPRRSNGEKYPFFQNEYEYLEGPTSPARCLNTVQNLMNWFQLAESPTWFWIHALKPVQNAEASGYSLGFWRPPGTELPPADKAPGIPRDLAEGHWTWNPHNWHALTGFLRYMPWNSRCLAVEEELKQHDNRILAFKRPDGKLVIVLSNRCTADYTFHLDTGTDATFRGFRYTPDQAGEGFTGIPCGEMSGHKISPTLPDMSWEFWIEE